MIESVAIHIGNGRIYISGLEIQDGRAFLSYYKILNFGHKRYIIEILNEWYKNNLSLIANSPISINIASKPIAKIVDFDNKSAYDIEKIINWEANNFLLNAKNYTHSANINDNSAFIAFASKDEILDLLNGLNFSVTTIDNNIASLANILSINYGKIDGILIHTEKDTATVVSVISEKIYNYCFVEKNDDFVFNLKSYINKIKKATSLNSIQIFASGDAEVVEQLEIAFSQESLQRLDPLISIEQTDDIISKITDEEILSLPISLGFCANYLSENGLAKINLITDEITPYIKEKTTPIKVNSKKIVLIALAVIIILSVVAYVLGSMFLKNMQESDNKITQDDGINMPQPQNYDDVKEDKQKEEELAKETKSNLDEINSRKETEKQALEPIKSQKIASSVKKESKKIIKETKKPTKTYKRKITPAKKVKLSSSRIESFIANEHLTPLSILRTISNINSITSIRLNNPQTVYLEVSDDDIESVKSDLQLSGLNVRILESEARKLIASHSKMTKSLEIKSMDNVSQIENKLSMLIRNYGGYPIVKEKSKPVGDYFSYTIKYIVPKVDMPQLVELLESIQQSYDGTGVSKIVYDNIKKELKLDITIYGK